MTYPSSGVNTSNLDAGTDKKQLARVDLLDLAQKFNQLRGHISAFMQGFLEASSAAAARAQLGIADGVFSFCNFGYATGVGDSYVAVAFGSPTINKGGAGMFTAPRAGFVRCRVGRFAYRVSSGHVHQVVLRFKQGALNQSPEFYANGAGVWSGAEAMFSCAAGDVFGVSVLANGGGTAIVTLAGCSFEMMD